MAAKRLDRLIGSMTLALLMGAPELAAQANGTFRMTPEANRARVATERRPEPPPQQAPVYHPGYPAPYAYPVAYTLIPGVVMSDGSVYANFGYGYELVRRPCASVIGSTNQIRVVAGNGRVLSGQSRAIETQPVPNQQTASQQMLSRGAKAPPQRNACFRHETGGRILVQWR